MPATTSSRLFHPPFDTRAAYVAARPLSWQMPDGSERKIASGAPFDRDELGCTDQQALSLYRARHILMVLGGGENPGPAASRPPAPPESPKPALRAKSLGFGRFIVIDADGRQVAPEDGKFFTKPEAEAYVNTH